MLLCLVACCRAALVTCHRLHVGGSAEARRPRDAQRLHGHQAHRNVHGRTPQARHDESTQVRWRGSCLFQICNCPSVYLLLCGGCSYHNRGCHRWHHTITIAITVAVAVADTIAVAAAVSTPCLWCSRQAVHRGRGGAARRHRQRARHHRTRVQRPRRRHRVPGEEPRAQVSGDRVRTAF